MHTPAARRWEPIVRHARRSGVSIRAYAREHGINENTLAWWHWRLGDDLREPTFVEVTVAPEPPRSLRIRVGLARVEVNADTDLALLRRVVEALS
jgi:transposase-like protein